MTAITMHDVLVPAYVAITMIFVVVIIVLVGSASLPVVDRLVCHVLTGVAALGGTTAIHARQQRRD